HRGTRCGVSNRSVRRWRSRSFNTAANKKAGNRAALRTRAQRERLERLEQPAIQGAEAGNNSGRFRWIRCGWSANRVSTCAEVNRGKTHQGAIDDYASLPIALRH